MNSKDGIDEPSRGTEGASTDPEAVPSSVSPLPDSDVNSSQQDIMKRAAAKSLIERYFYQLVDGCGNPHCDNKHCASNGEFKKLTPNEAAAEAIRLFQREAKLCDNQPTKVARTDVNKPTSSSSTTKVKVTPSISNKPSCETSNVISIKPNNIKPEEIPTSSKVISECSDSKEDIEISVKVSSEDNLDLKSDIVKPESSHTNVKTEPKIPNNGAPLSEERISELCKHYKDTQDESPLLEALSEVFSHPVILARSFACKSGEQSNAFIPKKEFKSKEEASLSSDDPDKDIDSVTAPDLDLGECQRAYNLLYLNVTEEIYFPILAKALKSLGTALEHDLRITQNISVDDILNCFLIVFQFPDIGASDFLGQALPAMCQAANYIPLKGQARLAKLWATKGRESLRHILESLQQLISIRVISRNYTRYFTLQDDRHVTHATKLMKIVYYASIIAGEVESNKLREESIVIPNQLDPLGDALDHIYLRMSSKQAKDFVPEDPLGSKLGVNVLDVRKPYVPFEEFYNEPLSDIIEMDKDFTNFKTDHTNLLPPTSNELFSFLRYPFILTPAIKSLGLYYDNRIRMYAERRVSIVNAFVGGVSLAQPFLRLQVRRNHIIDDALVELEMVAMERALDLKKQLVVEFIGEQGVDEGGVSKEFFQLVVEEIFNPDYGMFTTQPDSNTVWFNPMSFETEAQFTLIGIVLGLAIYNNIILAVNFPMVVYRKLMGKKGSFEDLADWNPHLYNGLKSMLDHQGDDMEETFVQTFRICYKDVFGNNVFHELKENGDDIFVTQENKHEFVELYTDYLLNKSVETQFKAFRRGFLMVTNESPLSSLFRPEEVELLVCGSKQFDFMELEKSTEYDGGYTVDSLIVKNFWTIAHSLSVQDQRKLLQFTTGSDRVPVGGLSHLKLVIARNGPDSDRLPTAHTCFNVLLLPEYDSIDKLKDRLLKAISYSKGFGML